MASAHDRRAVGTPLVPAPRPSAARARAVTPEVAAQVSAALRALADPLRLRILSTLSTSPLGEASAGEIASITDVTAPTVSHHLKVLRDLGLLTADRRGTRIYYRTTPTAHRALAALLESFAGSPPVGRPVVAASTELALEQLAETLGRRHPEHPRDLVLRTLRESYTALLRTAQGSPQTLARATDFADQRLTDLADIAAGAADPGPTSSESRPSRTDHPDRPLRVLFVCVANAGRSQLAAALLRRYAGEAVRVRSAGSSPAAEVHEVVRPLLEELGADPARTYPKPLTDDAVRSSDLVITMGCGDACPVVPGVRYEEWELGDPALASPEGARMIRDEIDARVRTLVDALLPRHDVPAPPPDPRPRRTEP